MEARDVNPLLVHASRTVPRNTRLFVRASWIVAKNAKTRDPARVRVVLQFIPPQKGVRPRTPKASEVNQVISRSLVKTWDFISFRKKSTGPRDT